MVYKHVYLSILMLLHSVFMLCIVKMSLKGEVGVSALNSQINYFIDHGKIMELCGNPDCICNES